MACFLSVYLHTLSRLYVMIMMMMMTSLILIKEKIHKKQHEQKSVIRQNDNLLYLTIK